MPSGFESHRGGWACREQRAYLGSSRPVLAEVMMAATPPRPRPGAESASVQCGPSLWSL